MKLEDLLEKFIVRVKESDQITIYNKAGIQHELAVFLQQQLDDNEYNVQVSREVEAVVLGAKGTDFTREAIDMYIYQLSGPEQYGVQVYLLTDEQEADSALDEQLKFLKWLKDHEFTKAFLLLVRHEQADAPALINSYSVKWQELQSESQDSNGPWLCAIVSI